MNNIHKHMEQMYDSNSAYVYTKCSEGYYLAANKGFLECNALSSEQELIGVSDHDLVPNKTALEFQKNDHDVISKDLKKIFIECHQTSLLSTYYLSYKMPLRCISGKILGVLGLSVPVNKMDKSNIFFNMLFSGCDQSNSKQMIPIIKIKNNISHRQAECLYYLKQGKTMKEISEILNLSARTIEYYIALLKEKFNSSTRSDLIEKSFC